ncbi:DUF4113 domain-containing protein [Aeromonas veronii]
MPTKDTRSLLGLDTSAWMMKREQLSPRYTTSVREIPTVFT